MLAEQVSRALEKPLWAGAGASEASLLGSEMAQMVKVCDLVVLLLMMLSWVALAFRNRGNCE